MSNGLTAFVPMIVIPGFNEAETLSEVVSPALAPDRLNAIRVAGFFVYWASGLKLEDTQSGYRAYPVALFDDVALRHGGFVLETEVLIAAAGRGWQVREVPVRAIPRARRRSRFRPLGDGVAIGAYLAGRVAARWAREAAAGGWWRHPRRRRAAAAATATLAAPVLLVLLALQALVARRLPDVVTPLVERLCSQVRLDLPGEPGRAALMTPAVPREAPGGRRPAPTTWSSSAADRPARPPAASSPRPGAACSSSSASRSRASTSASPCCRRRSRSWIAWAPTRRSPSAGFR